MAGSDKSRHTPNTRKPVTIDLEAKPGGADEGPVDASTNTSNAPVNPSDKNQKSEPAAEPVAFDEIADKNKSSEASDDDASQKAEKPGSGEGNTKAAGKSSSGALMGGIIGGAISLLAFGGLQWSGVLPSLGGASTSSTTIVETEIAGLKEQIAALKQSSSMAPAAAELPADITEQLSAASAAAQEAKSEVNTVQQSIAALGERVDGLQTSLSNVSSGDNGADTAALKEQLTGVTETLSGLKATLSTQGEKIDATEAALSQKITDLGTRLAKIEEMAAKGGANTDVAIAIAAAGLKSAIDRGSSFMAELEAFASVSQKTDIIEGLRNYAAGGVPTVNQLTDQFANVANNIVAAGKGLSEDASIADRLMQSARSLIQVRPVGEVEGETPGAIAARIETRLKSNDLSGALEQWETLPDAAKKVSADFADKIQARKSVDALVAQTLSDAMISTTSN